MVWPRVVNRNGLKGGYEVSGQPHSLGIGHLLGDLRRLEADSVDDNMSTYYAKRANIELEGERLSKHEPVTMAQAKAVLRAFFSDGGTFTPEGWLRGPHEPPRN